MASEGGAKQKVVLHVYDLSMGMARTMSMSVVGKQFDGIWHTGIFAYGYEYFYGGGLQREKPEAIVAGFGIAPCETIELGETEVTQAAFEDWMRGMSARFTPSTYDLFSHNCNNFTNEASQFLLGKGIPKHIVDLPAEFLATDMGKMLKPMITGMQTAAYERVGSGNPFAAMGAGDTSAYSTAALPTSAAAVPTSATPPTPPPEATKLLKAEAKPLLSSDTRTIKPVVSRMEKAAYFSEAEMILFRETAEGFANEEIEVSGAKLRDFSALLLRLVSDSKHDFKGLCLLRLVVLREDGAKFFVTGEGASCLVDVARKLQEGSFTTDAARLMAYTVISNLFATEAGATFACSADIAGKAIDCGLAALHEARDNVRQLAAALLHNYSCCVAVVSDDGGISDHGTQLLCGLAGDIHSESVKAIQKRRLLGIGRLAQRSSELASMGSMLGFGEQLQAIVDDGSANKTNRGLAMEVLACISTHEDATA